MNRRNGIFFYASFNLRVTVNFSAIA
ncbi:Protein of unknown function [Escherichia coli D6-113.11]|nr:Protein of unknown function [Escherichia coli D6-113.11]CDU36014.1 Protein of unknown function [Escherichia coli D6-113.11]